MSWFFAVCSAVRYSIFSVLLFWYHSMRATMVVISMLTACPALVEAGMPHYMVAAPGRPTLHDGGSRVFGSLSGFAAVQAIPLRCCCWHSAGNTVYGRRTSPIYAAQVGGSRTADTTGRSDFTADTTGRECSDMTDCTTPQCAAEPARHVTVADASMCTIAAQLGGSHSTAVIASAANCRDSCMDLRRVNRYGTRMVITAGTIAAGSTSIPIGTGSTHLAGGRSRSTRDTRTASVITVAESASRLRRDALLNGVTGRVMPEALW